MGRTAKVASIDVLPLLAAAVQKFRSEGQSAVDDLETELRRALDWIHHERKDHWAQEWRRANEALIQARLKLQQAMVTRRVADREPSCIDEKRAVERATRRVATAQRKIEAVRRWTATIDRAADDFRRARTQFATWLDIDVSRAAAALDQMSESLVTYISLEAPSEAVRPVAPKEAGTGSEPGGSDCGKPTASEVPVPVFSENAAKKDPGP
jgi:hypothetical protein